MSCCWYAVASHPNKEDLLWKQLTARDIEVFYPRVRVKPVNPRSRKIRPYFPGYLFILADLEALGASVIQYMPHAKGLVTFGDEPTVVPDHLIDRLKQRFGQAGIAAQSAINGPRNGEIVEIGAGPLNGYEAIFDMCIPGTERVRVLLKMLSDRQVPVVLDSSYIKKR